MQQATNNHLIDGRIVFLEIVSNVIVDVGLIIPFLIQDLKEVFGKAGAVLFADAHKKRVGEG